MKVVLDEDKNKMSNKLKIFYISIIVICIISVILAIVLQSKTDEEEYSKKVPQMDQEQINTYKDEFDTIFKNKVNYMENNSYKIMKVKKEEEIIYTGYHIKENKINIFEIDEQLEKISSDVKNKLDIDFEEYGIDLKQFFITTIVKPDGDIQYEKFKDLHFRKYADIAEAELQQKVDIINQQTSKQKMIIEAEGKAEKRKTEGYTYQEERSYDVAEKVAENEGAGNFSSAGIGMGIMSSVGNAVNNTFGTAMTNMENNSEKYCDNCGNKIENNQKFCDNCGQEINKNQVCKYCSYKFTKQGKFCPNCGKERS